MSDKNDFMDWIISRLVRPGMVEAWTRYEKKPYLSGFKEITSEEAEALEIIGITVYAHLEFPSGSGVLIKHLRNVSYSEDMFDGPPTIQYFIREEGEP